MENGVISDPQITASSIHNYKHDSRNARLHFKGDPLTLVSAGWAAGLLNTNQWLQVDLQHITSVIGIATQGRHDYDQWVTEYKLQYGDDGQTYSVYSRNGDTSETVWILMTFWTKYFLFFLLGGWDNEKQSRVPKSNRTWDLRILRSNALTLRHSHLTGSWTITRFIIYSNMSFSFLLLVGLRRVLEISEIKLC